MAPHEWSDWLTTMFNDADETGLAPNQIGPGAQDKRSNIIPALAEYKMPGLRGDIVSADGTVYATLKNQQNLVVKWPAAGDSTTDADILAWMRARFAEAEKAIGVTVTISDQDLLAQYRTQRYQPFTVVEDITPDAGRPDPRGRAGGQGLRLRRRAAPHLSARPGAGPRARLPLARPAAQQGQVPQRRRHLRPLQGRLGPGVGVQQGPHSARMAAS